MLGVHLYIYSDPRAHHGYTAGAKFGHRTLTREHRTRTGYGSTPASLTCSFAPKPQSPHTCPLTNINVTVFRVIQYYCTVRSALDVEAVESGNDGVRISSLPEVGKGEATKRALLIEMIVERVRNSSEETRSDCLRLSWNS